MAGNEGPAVNGFAHVEMSAGAFDPPGLRHLTFRSPALGRRGDVTVFIPRHAQRAEPLPLVLLLHGVYGSHWAWTMKGGVHLTAQQLIDNGRIRPVAIAMPCDGMFGDGSGYFAHNGTDYEAWIVEDVPGCVLTCLSELSEDAPLFIAGLSMGGFGALRLGAKHAQRFQAISAHSAFTRAEHLRMFVDCQLDFYGDLSDERLTALYWLRQHRRRLPFLRFDCGSRDQLIDINHELHDALIDDAIDHLFVENPGGHDWEYWQRHVEDTLLFFEECRDRPRYVPSDANIAQLSGFGR
jgi:putative tributyrin esterase